jgi:HAD superfamily phosphoserine phosphatase-like hydrolase
MNEWTAQVNEALAALLQPQSQKRYAVFDADGTLWPDDLGEAFFQHQIQNRLAPRINEQRHPWENYLSIDRQSTADANAWLAKLQSGLKISELRDAAKKYYEAEFKPKVNPHMRDLIQKLQGAGFEIWICSASLKWAIEPCLYDLNISPDQIIGTESEINTQGFLTSTIQMPVPYGEGKKYWIQNKLPQLPDLVVGNSVGDLPMLTLAQSLPLVINYNPPKNGIENSERALRLEAEARGWLIQRFETPQ